MRRATWLLSAAWVFAACGAGCSSNRDRLGASLETSTVSPDAGSRRTDRRDASDDASVDAARPSAMQPAAAGPSEPASTQPQPGDAGPTLRTDAAAPRSDDADGGPVVNEGAADGLSRPPPEHEPAARHDDCTFSSSPAQLVPSDVFTPPAWAIAVDARFVYFTDRRPAGCIVGTSPPGGACDQEGVVWRMPRCGGPKQALGLPFPGEVRIALGGDRLYVRARNGLFRIDPDSGASERLAIDPMCVADFAANASQLLVADSCAHTLRRLAVASTQVETVAESVDAANVAMTDATAYVATAEGVRWFALGSATSGLLTRELAMDSVLQLAADAHAVVALSLNAGRLRVVRIQLDGAKVETWTHPSAAQRMAVADGFIYFAVTTNEEPVDVMRVATAGAATVEPSVAKVLLRDIAAYGSRVYFTAQGAVSTGTR